MPLETSFEQPVPVARFAELVEGYISRLGQIWVDGQIAEISLRPGAGVVFLTLRDPAQDASVSVTCFRNVFDKLVPAPATGDRVVVHGKPQFYPKRGQFSLRAEEIRRVGIGELLARLEELKQRLRAEGLFEPGRKKPLPFLPVCVGLITGRASAAERDVQENARRRWGGVRFEVREVAVQGPTAVVQVTAALAELDAHPEVDVIVIARGGGSVEDLLPFSDERLIRAVADCRTPVVSAIGHEPDSPLLDLVADLRASTPTDAAKRIVPDIGQELERIGLARLRLRRAVTGQLDREAQRLASFRSRPVLAAPYGMIERAEAELGQARDRTARALRQQVARDGEVLVQRLARVRALSPLATLERGYAVVQRMDGSVVRTPSQLGPGERLGIRVAGGSFAAVATADADADAAIAAAAGAAPAAMPDADVLTGDEADSAAIAVNSAAAVAAATQAAEAADAPTAKPRAAKSETAPNTAAKTAKTAAAKPGPGSGRAAAAEAAAQTADPAAEPEEQHVD
ncbi:MAG TPA: exodeoxyribonuclease VII large subunit [Actinocrinis sp.]|nr:exodeoxyribonuclease VII large subunit [Actinocrinis sp.]